MKKDGVNMPKTVSATEMQNRFGTMADWAITAEDDVIVESRGTPKVVLISFAEYRKLCQWREQARRQEVLQRIRALREEVRARNQDLTEESADALAEEIRGKTLRRIVEAGNVPYEER
jgi:prevent-host-death family protein